MKVLLVILLGAHIKALNSALHCKSSANGQTKFYIKGHNQEGHKPRRVGVSCVTNVVTNDS